METSGWSPCTPLVTFIRDHNGLKGTKNNCAYGSTGASCVIMSSWHPGSSKFVHRTINSCSTPLASAHRTNITTVEGIGSPELPHPLQKQLVSCHAIQCGYDTAGIVVTAYGLLLNNPRRPSNILTSWFINLIDGFVLKFSL